MPAFFTRTNISLHNVFLYLPFASKDHTMDFFFLNRCIREIFIFMIGLGFKRIDEGLFSQCWDFAEQIHFWVICHSFLFPLLFWCFWVPSVGNLKIKSLLFNSEALNNHKLVAIYWVAFKCERVWINNSWTKRGFSWSKLQKVGLCREIPH